MKSKKIISIIINLYQPGLGNIISGDKKYGIVMFCTTLFIYAIYIMTIIMYVFSVEPEILTFILSCLAIILMYLHLALIVFSIIRVYKLN